jgi:hypothetical protein
MGMSRLVDQYGISSRVRNALLGQCGLGTHVAQCRWLRSTCWTQRGELQALASAERFGRFAGRGQLATSLSQLRRSAHRMSA